MNTLSSRLALASSGVALLLAGIALWIASGDARGSRRDVTALAPSTSWDGEPSTENGAPESEIQSLRDEVAALRAALERSDAEDERRPLPLDVASAIEPVAGEANPDDDLGEFQLRRELIESFATFDSSDREDALVKLAGLARWGDKEALAVITASLADESGKVRARALRELARLDKANLSTYLRQTADDTCASVREVVASRIDALPAAESGPMLMKLLHDSDSSVVIEAIQSAGKLKHAEALPVLEELLKAKDLDVATRAACTLKHLGNDSARVATIERITRDLAQGSVSRRVRNVKRLGRLHAVPQLEQVLDSENSLAVREAARDALAKLEH